MQPALKVRGARLLAVAIAWMLVFLAVGIAAARQTPGPLDTWALSLVGHGNLVAWIFTWSLYTVWLVPLGLIMLVIGIVYPQWRARVVVSLVLLLLMWAASDLLQHLFMRPRPIDWVVKHETAFSYPSTHAALAIAFYGYWAYILKRSELSTKIRIVGSEALTALVIAILWSRLALGAHYPSDLLGGVLLGASGMALALAACTFLGIELTPRMLGD